MSTTATPPPTLHPGGARPPLRSVLRAAALIVAAVGCLAFAAAAVLVARQRILLHQLPAPQAPAGFATTLPSVPDAWTRWTSACPMSGPLESEAWASAWAWLRGSAREPAQVARFLAADAPQRAVLLEALRAPLRWSTLAVDPWGFSSGSAAQQVRCSLPSLRVAACNLQLAAAGDPKPDPELRGLDTLSDALWPPTAVTNLMTSWGAASSRDQAYLLAVAQGRLGAAEAAGWLREPARNVSGLIQAEQVDQQYWQPLWARWDVTSGLSISHARWLGSPSKTEDIWEWLQAPSASQRTMTLDHDLIERLRGGGLRFPFFDLPAYRGTHLHDTDMWAYVAQEAVLADAQHRAHRLAAAVLLYQRAHGALPSTLAAAGIADVGSDQPHPVDLPLGYCVLSGWVFEVRVPASTTPPEFVTPGCITSDPVGTKSRAPLQEVKCGLRVDGSAFGR